MKFLKNDSFFHEHLLMRFRFFWVRKTHWGLTSQGPTCRADTRTLAMAGHSVLASQKEVEAQKGVGRKG